MSLHSAALAVLLSIAAFPPIVSQAQGPPASSGLAEHPAASSQTATNPGTFAGEPFVIHRAETVYSYNADGTGSRDQTYTVAVQSDVALRTFGVLSIPFASASEHVLFRYARVRHSDGSVVETDLSTMMEQPEQVTREAPLYSDLKQAQLPVKSLRLGDTLEWQVHIERFKLASRGNSTGNSPASENCDLPRHTGSTCTRGQRPISASC